MSSPISWIIGTGTQMMQSGTQASAAGNPRGRTSYTPDSGSTASLDVAEGRRIPTQHPTRSTLRADTPRFVVVIHTTHTWLPSI